MLRKETGTGKLTHPQNHNLACGYINGAGLTNATAFGK